MLALHDILCNKHGVNTVVVYDFWRMGVYFFDLVIVHFNSIDYSNDFSSSLIHFLEVGSFFAEF